MNPQGQPTALVRQPVPPPRPAYHAASPRSDPSRNRPLRWTQRYELVLRLHLAGWRTIEIAAKLRYSPHRVSMVIHSALFEERIRELRGESRGPFLDGIERDAVANFDFPARTARRRDEAGARAAARGAGDRPTGGAARAAWRARIGGCAPWRQCPDSADARLDAPAQ
jgi:hypothetical protein